MRRIVDLRQRLEIEVRINLRGRDAGVTEHLLHRAQVLRRLQHVAGERMAQHVRVHRGAQPLALRPCAQPRLNRAGRDPPAAGAHEQRALTGRRHQRTLLQPGAQGFARAAADRNGAGLRALAGHGDFSLLQIQPAVFGVQRHQFRQAQARGVQQFEHGAVARRFWRFGCRRFQQPLHLFHGKRLRQGARRLRRAHALHRVGGEAAMAREPTVQNAPGRERQRERATRESRCVQARDEAPDLLRVEIAQRGFFLQFK